VSEKAKSADKCLRDSCHPTSEKSSGKDDPSQSVSSDLASVRFPLISTGTGKSGDTA